MTTSLTDEENEGPEVVILDEHGNELEEGNELTREERQAGGGYIKSPGNTRYWLNTNQLAEFYRMDRTIVDDSDFWAWFDAAKIKWGLSGESSGRGRLDKFISKWSYQSEKPKYLSDAWGGSKWFNGYGGSGTSEEARELAVALMAVQSTIRVVDTHERRMVVRLAATEGEGKPESYTDYGSRIIQVSAMALRDKKLEKGDAIDITTGFALHEASHAQYSERTLSAMRQPTLLLPAAVVGILHNILEDGRIERKTTAEFPGFEGYFDRANSWLWSIQQAFVPAVWGPTLNDKVSAVIAATKWHADFLPFAAKDAVLLAETMWWKDWWDRYMSEKTGLRALLVEGLERLGSDPNTKKELDQMTANEKAMAEFADAQNSAEDLARLIRESVKKHGLDKTGACMSTESATGQGAGKGVRTSRPGVGASTAAEVARLMESEVEVGKITDFHIPKSPNGGDCQLVVLHPPETPESKRRYKVAHPALVMKMRNAFFFRPSAEEISTKLLRSGSIDDDELWRAGAHDYRVFEQKNVVSTPDTSITLLVDLSGSMTAGSYYSDRKAKIDTAIEMAQVMQACLKDMQGVKVRVRGHTGDNSDNPGRGGMGGGPVLYKIWEQGEPMTRLAIAHTVDHSDNYDSIAIGYCVNELVENAGLNEQLIVIVLSDGWPSGRNGYGGTEGENHVRQIVNWAANKGVSVTQIAIDHGLDPVRQARMYTNWVPFENEAKLPSQLTAMLKRIFPGR